MLTAIVGILLGNLLIATLFAPALQELRKILSNFEDIQLPHRAWPGAPQMSAAQRQEAKETAVTNFNRLFRKYTMSFNAFRKVGVVFIIAIVVLACAVAWQMSLTVETFVFRMIAFVSVIVFAGRFLQMAVAPTPVDLISIDFLQNNFANLHLSSLFDCSSVHIDAGRELHETVMHFNISQNMMFSGYRFLTAVSNSENSQLYFVAYGEMDRRVNFQQIWTPEIQLFSTPLGDFSLTDAIRVSPSLRLHSWLFVPTPRGWINPKKVNPRFLSQDITESMGGTVGIILNLSNFVWASIDENVEFGRKSAIGLKFWKITQLIVPAADSPQRILRMYKNKLEHCSGIQSHDYPDGITVKN